MKTKTLAEILKESFFKEDLPNKYIDETWKNNGSWNMFYDCQMQRLHIYFDDVNGANAAFNFRIQKSDKKVCFSNYHREIDEAFRGQGIGTRLLEQMEDAFLQYGNSIGKKVKVIFDQLDKLSDKPRVQNWLMKNGYQENNSGKYYKELSEVLEITK